MLRSKAGRRIGVGIVGLAVAAALLVPTAFGRSASSPTAAGKSVFSTTCAACHTLKAAGAVGNIGPNLDKTANKLSLVQITKAITNGGASVMTKAAIAKYTTTMVAYKGSLPTKTIAAIAAFVYASTHK